MMTLPHPSGLAHAMRQYRRLCADPETGAANRASAVPLVVAGLAYTPRLVDILRVVAEADGAVSTWQVCTGLGPAMYPSLVGTHLLRLASYGLVDRTRTQHHWRYTLSALGRLVMTQLPKED